MNILYTELVDQVQVIDKNSIPSFKINVKDIKKVNRKIMDYRILISGTPLQYSCLENAMDRGACWATDQRVTKSWAQISMQAWYYHM